MKYKQDIGLIPNVSYGDFVLGSNINMRPLQNPFYNLSFLNILCTFIV